MWDRINEWIGNKCWDIGDWFFGQWLKRVNMDDGSWHEIDVHANCQPKQPAITITPATYSTGTTTNLDTLHASLLP